MKTCIEANGAGKECKSFLKRMKMTGKVIQELYRWHDETKVCFYGNLNCSVWHIVRAKNTFFTHNKPSCLLKVLLCKEVVFKSM